ncbi:hydrolase [Marinobacterium nitratireducens]|uniref:Hydrolase n=1 Tax=Marinobacterium nitratireducens TaxID=518897 RepID=A0A917ZHK8_9GAMM|nr:carbon-nitrogen hydrolase family protein [Marinobacterium nitratireducens]GGO82831.1 hydrolase [Marinobacterium nitratireducens]
MNSRIAVIQMTSGGVLEDNLRVADRLVREAASAGARLVLLPENFALFDSARLRELAGRGDEVRARLADLAAGAGVWLVAGSLPLAERPDGTPVPAPRVRAACLVFDETGTLRARYDKRHLFDVDVADAQRRYRESDYIEPGETPVVVETPVGCLGLSICYDLRFAQHYQALRDAGAQLITVPSAFTAVTGEAHWELLLRARAVETQCYLLGADQGGRHANGRETWGHSMIVDPWGEVLGVQTQGEGGVVAEFDRERLRGIREKMPLQMHRKMVSREA